MPAIGQPRQSYYYDSNTDTLIPLGGGAGRADNLHRYSATPPTDLVDGQQWFDSDLVVSNPYDTRGTVAFASSGGAQAGITAVTDLTGLSIGFTAVAGRRYRITAQALVQGTVAGTTMDIHIMDNTGSVVAKGRVCPSAIYGATCIATAIVVPGAGAKTYKARLELSVGSGTVGTYVDANWPTYILAEDIGT